MMKTTHLTIALVVAMTSMAAHSEPPEAATPERAAAPVTVYVNARVHTGDEDLPRAGAFVTRGDRFVFVGSAGDALRHAAGEGAVVDLRGRFVMPGIVDAHTHPGLVALSGDLSALEAVPGEKRPVGTGTMPSRPKEATLAWLRRYADDHPSAPMIVQGAWDVAAYLPHGPHKRDLDAISSTRPIVLLDSSGHSYWVNSAMLRLLGIDRNTPDLSANVSHFARDGNGEPTGWVKEFALIPYIGGRPAPDAGTLKARLLAYLNYMSSKGVTTLWDAGSVDRGDAVHRAAHAIAKDGGLPLRWEGSYHVWAPEQLETAVQSLLRLREEYGHGKLRFDTVKIHYDGMPNILTAAMLERYATDPGNRGGVLFPTRRLSRFMRELDGHGIDLHLHAAGDRAARNILDAVEQAREALGRPLRIEVTASHLFSVAETDIERFGALDVHANFTPHWFGRTVFGEAWEVNLGPERAGRSQLVGRFFARRANVTLSSDVIHDARRVSPFIGIETSMTRRGMGEAAAPALPPADAAISLEQALAGYTVNGAAQLGREEELGAIKAGFLADFIVLPRDPFETDVRRIHKIVPAATIVAGELRSGALPRAAR